MSKQIHKISHNGNEYEFICEWKNTRNGFKHECRLFKNGTFETSATCNYINRTWESYEYQSVMLRAISILLEEHTEFLKYAFKDSRGYDKMTQKRNAEFQAVLDADEMVAEFLAIKKKLNRD